MVTRFKAEVAVSKFFVKDRLIVTFIGVWVLFKNKTYDINLNFMNSEFVVFYLSNNKQKIVMALFQLPYL